MLIRRLACVALTCVALVGATAVGHAVAASHSAAEGAVTGDTVAIDPSTGLPAARGPLVVVPSTCAAPPKALAVFEGTVLSSFGGVVQFRFGRLLAGDLSGHSTDQAVEVHYGDDGRYLAVGQRYLVGVAVESSTGFLLSSVREAAPLFGGDAVVGRYETDVKCPVVSDPARTLLTDGTAIDTGVLTPLSHDKRGLVKALVLPVLIASGALLLIVLVKFLLVGFFGSLRDLADTQPRR